ncbi:MAG: flagellar protein FliT [Lachnospiraceae bacterium]|nr:flagellar protein FliT [Lachnospiraceae bacterium]
MNETKNYIDILVDSLEKKYNTLVKIEEIEKKQEDVLLGKKVSATEFNDLFDEKGKYIEKLEELDLGFEKLYERVKEELGDNKDTYKEEILAMQDLIRKISDLTVSLQARQNRNKEKYMAFFSNKKQEIKQFKMSSKTVSNYYKNMYNSHQEGSSYFLDKKK